MAIHFPSFRKKVASDSLDAHENHAHHRVRIALIIVGILVVIGGIIYAFYWYRTGRYIADPRKLSPEDKKAMMVEFDKNHPVKVLDEDEKSKLQTTIGTTTQPQALTDEQKAALLRSLDKTKPHSKPW